jgi:hypothetical protein
MNNLSKKYRNEEGTEETLVASSDDNYEIKLSGNYTLSNHKEKKESRLAKKFKGSILGSDIGVKSSGFSSVAILATVIALAAALIMYFIWRF